MSPSSQIPGASTAPRPADGADLALVRRAVCSRDQEAIDGVLARLSCVVRFVFRLNRHLGYGLPTDALEDVVQQVYAAIWPRLRDFHGGATLESWAFGFCRNCLRAEARRRSRGLRLLPQGVADDDLELDGAAQACGPEGEVAHREGLDVLRAALERLEPSERQIVELRFFEDWSFERIARELAIAPSTVKDRCARALLRMKDRLRSSDVDA